MWGFLGNTQRRHRLLSFFLFFFLGGGGLGGGGSRMLRLFIRSSLTLHWITISYRKGWRYLVHASYNYFCNTTWSWLIHDYCNSHRDYWGSFLLTSLNVHNFQNSNAQFLPVECNCMPVHNTMKSIDHLCMPLDTTMKSIDHSCMPLDTTMKSTDHSCLPLHNTIKSIGRCLTVCMYTIIFPVFKKK